VRDWASVIETHRLVELSAPEVDAILAAFPVPDADVAAAISEGAAGLPFYLGLQLDIHRDLVGEGVKPTPEHFARAPKAVLARFASHLGERLATAFTTLAHARRFDEQLFAHLKDHPGTLIGPVGLPEITRYSLVEVDQSGVFRLHQHYQDLQREELARTRPDDQRRIDEALFTYWDAACQPPDLRRLSLAHETALREAAHHQEFVAPTEHVGWLASRWPPFLLAARLRLCEDLWQAVLDLAERGNGAKSAAMAVALGSLGIVLQMLGRLDDARDAQQRALAINEKVFGPDHYEVAITLVNLGNVLHLRGRSDDARDAHQRALAINEKFYGPDHYEVAATLGNLGVVFQMLGRLADARDALERALAIKEKAYGPDHHEVAVTLTNLGVLIKQLDDFPTARAVEERALTIFERQLSPAHPQTAQICENLAITLERLGEAGRAGELKARAAAIRGGDAA
jgi:tetratricopeptide (TPR) repeat protein